MLFTGRRLCFTAMAQCAASTAVQTTVRGMLELWAWPQQLVTSCAHSCLPRRFTYLDVMGRTVVVLRARNIVPQQAALLLQVRRWGHVLC